MAICLPDTLSFTNHVYLCHALSEINFLVMACLPVKKDKKKKENLNLLLVNHFKFLFFTLLQKKRRKEKKGRKNFREID